MLKWIPRSVPESLLQAAVQERTVDDWHDQVRAAGSREAYKIHYFVCFYKFAVFVKIMHLMNFM